MLHYPVLFQAVCLSKQQNKTCLFRIDNNTINTCSINATVNINLFFPFISPQSLNYGVNQYLNWVWRKAFNSFVKTLHQKGEHS